MRRYNGSDVRNSPIRSQYHAQNKGGGPQGGGSKVSVAQMVSSGGSSERKKRDERHDATPRAEQRNGPAYREVRQALHDEAVQPSLQHHAAGGQGQVQPPQHTQYPPGYAHGSSGELPYTETTQWLSGELPQTGRGMETCRLAVGKCLVATARTTPRSDTQTQRTNARTDED